VTQHGIAGVDPHKRSVTIAVVDPAGAEVDVASFDNTHCGLAAGLRWLADLQVRVDRIGVEGSSGHGRHLAERLVAAGYDTREVPPRRTAERRRSRRRSKTDREDALAIARATAGEPNLGPVKPGAGLGDAHEELVVVGKHRQVLVARRATMLNHAEAALADLPRQITDTLPGGRAVAPRLAAIAEKDLPDIGAGAAATVRLLIELAADIGELTHRIGLLERRLAELVTACGSTLTEEPGIGVVGAATLLAEVGDPGRFRSESAFNRWWGGAPVAVSSGEGDQEPVRHRLDLLGNRTVNCVLYIMSVTQSRFHEPAQTYLANQRSHGHSTKEARRAHKVQLGRRVIRRMWADQRRAMRRTGPTKPTVGPERSTERAA
jgi:transposase